MALRTDQSQIALSAIFEIACGCEIILSLADGAYCEDRQNAREPRKVQLEGVEIVNR
jgi:hypothetical protein